MSPATTTDPALPRRRVEEDRERPTLPGASRGRRLLPPARARSRDDDGQRQHPLNLAAGSLTVKNTADFGTTGNFTVRSTPATARAPTPARSATTFTGISGCTGTPKRQGDRDAGDGDDRGRRRPERSGGNADRRLDERLRRRRGKFTSPALAASAPTTARRPRPSHGIIGLHGQAAERRAGDEDREGAGHLQVERRHAIVGRSAGDRARSRPATIFPRARATATSSGSPSTTSARRRRSGAGASEQGRHRRRARAEHRLEPHACDRRSAGATVARGHRQRVDSLRADNAERRANAILEGQGAARSGSAPPSP